MTLSIIIPTHKRSFQVQQLLHSIAEQNFPQRNLQVLLVSNLKDKKLREKASYWESVFFDFKYLEVGRKGVNKARNMGIRFARGDILYFLDDDCFLDNKDHLSLLVLEHEKSAVGIGGGYKSLGDSHGLEKFYQENTEQWIKGSSSEKQTEQLVGGNASYKRKVFDKGFYFDPSIVFGGSEEGFNRSLRAHGWTLLFVDKLNILHNLKLSWLAFIRKSFKQGLGSVKLYSKKEEHSLKNKWAFLYKDSHSIYSVVYNLFFKLGFFWGVAAQGRKGKFFQLIRFIFLFFKSRWYFFRDYFVKWFYGRILLRFLGNVWYVAGWLYGKILWPAYTIGLLKPLGLLWYGLGWLYGKILWPAYTIVLLKLLGMLWYGLGWLYGKILWPAYTIVLLKPLGMLWYGLGWLYGQVFLKVFGKLWYGLGWFYGQVFLKVFGKLWYGLGWFYGRILLFLFHHSPPMKLYYFSEYQYHKRIKPLLNKKRSLK